MQLNPFSKSRKSKRKAKTRARKPAGPFALVKQNAWSLFRWLRNFVFILIGVSVLATLALRWINPPYTNFMLTQRITTDFVPYKINWVPIKTIAPEMLIAAVAAEDQKFPDHYGFDLKAIQSAIENNKNNKGLRGASTITQQVAKNMFLWRNKSLFRKGLEAYFALLIETLWPKWRILEVYLNVAEFGPNIYGIQNAAFTHFKKTADQLTQHEASLLAAVLPNPHRMHASRPSEYVYQRATHITSQTKSLGGSHYLKDIW